VILLLIIAIQVFVLINVKKMIRGNIMPFNPLALELDIYSSAHYLCKM